ncbi:MAG: phospho-sugar mutase, partial [Bacteroidales bacterium]|nr:phospho-sugar mutase [Bacteroidales bacterium]
MDENILKKAQLWLSDSFDEETRKQVQALIDSQSQELTESFYRDLEFGTGGLRGIMGVGTNRMNQYTVAMATQGLANYLNQCFVGESISVAIAYDSRLNSAYFAQTAADVLSANGIKVYLFDALRPTPELSFAIRHFGCKSGIMVTASHNPKEYNGYKAYWCDGGQVVPPHDKNIIAEVQKVTDPSMVKMQGNPKLIQMVGKEVDDIYLDLVRKLSLSPEVIQRQHDLKIVYTPLHGTGLRLVPEALAQYGFTNVSKVPAQSIADGNFPTVVSPNPEESKALTMAIEQARAEDAELVLATDPDADRVGIAVKNDQGEFILLNGNQTASILFYYILNRWKESGKIDDHLFTVKTIVTSDLLAKISQSFQVPCFEVLTGFKYIADIILRNEGKRQYVVGGEESYGYLTGDFVRDKDAVSSCCMIAEAAAYAKDNGKSMYALLQEIYQKYGYFQEHLVSLTKKGKSGSEEIADMMKNYRSCPPKTLHQIPVVMIKDYKALVSKDLKTGKEEKIDLPTSNVLQFYLEDGSKITVRPSGTEPKIKFYFGLVDANVDHADYETVKKRFCAKIEAIVKD